MDQHDVEERRARLEEFMPDTAALYRPGVQTRDGEGGYTAPMTLVATEPCRWAMLTGRELVRAQAIAAEADSAVTLPALTGTKHSDQIVVTVSETGDILHFEVEHVVRRSQSFQERVLCKNVTPNEL